MAGRWLRLTSTYSATKSSVSDRLQHPAAIAYRPAELPTAGPTQFTPGVNRAALGRVGLSRPSDLAGRVNKWIDGVATSVRSGRCTAGMEALFDHLLGGGEDRRRDGQPHRLCGLEIEDQLEFRDLLHR